MISSTSRSDVFLSPGQLWPRILAQTDHAHRTGALQPIATEQQLLPSDDISFVVRRLTQIHRKETATKQQKRQGINPFLPCDPDLFVGHFSTTHLGLLNKFNAVDHHLLIVTRQFEDQQLPLTESDFAVALQVLQEKPGLIFYNSGPVAGASQPHRHLQWIPFPLASDAQSNAAFPLQLWYDDLASRSDTCLQISSPFSLAIVRLNFTEISAQNCYSLYKKLLVIANLNPGNSEKPAPYNLLMTREWLTLIPRTQERYQDIEVNALGFAGGLLVRTDDQLDWLQKTGPWHLLQQVAVTKAGEA